MANVKLVNLKEFQISKEIFNDMHVLKNNEKKDKFIFSIKKATDNNSNSNSNNNSSSTNNISNISLGEEEEYDDDEIGVIRNNSCDYFSKAEERSHLKDFLASINNYRKNTENMIDEEDNIFIDEDEKKNENIFYIENETKLTNLLYYNKKNKYNI